jgi:xanthosine utilization system XapX-like protein
MAVAVVQIRLVAMLMGQIFVLVEMRMPAAWILLRMVVVLIHMLVGMVVTNCFMGMAMLVLFAHQKPDGTYKQCACCTLLQVEGFNE